jgi:Putative prokaryotic signal transducing protein
MATNAPEPSDALVTVFDTEQESEAMVVKGLLESEGIDSILTNLDAPQDVLPGVGGVVLQVRPEQADEARRLIQDSRQTPQEQAEAEATAENSPDTTA